VGGRLVLLQEFKQYVAEPVEVVGALKPRSATRVAQPGYIPLDFGLVHFGSKLPSLLLPFPIKIYMAGVVSREGLRLGFGGLEQHNELTCCGSCGLSLLWTCLYCQARWGAYPRLEPRPPRPKESWKRLRSVQLSNSGVLQ